MVVLTSFAAAAALAVPGLAVVPDAVPDRGAVLSEPLRRGALVVAPAPDRKPSAKTVDGLVTDWVGAASGIGGTSRYDAGEHVYTDFLFDDYGADDGDDAERLAVLGPLAAAEDRTSRADQLFQAAGDQFGAPRPFGAPDRYGDVEAPDAADLREVRWAVKQDKLAFLARTTTLTDANQLGVLVLVDRDGRPAGTSREVGFGTGLTTAVADTAVLLTSAGAAARDLLTGQPVKLRGASVVVDATGWTNALEASLPVSLLGSTGRVTVLSGLRTADGLTPLNVAYRSAEPVAGVYNDQRQALALQAGSVDEFAVVLDLNRMARGGSEAVRPGPGYHERQMVSGENISKESGENGIWQPYGLYVPTAYDPAAENPLNFWLHYRGGKAHSGGAWTPRLLTQLGEESDAVVVTPRARGTSTWYVSEAHQDFFEVFADVHSLLSIDEDRRYLSGYSMGGYGTYLFGLLYPDLFAAGYSASGAVTQGAWTGFGPDDSTCAQQCFVEANEGDADAQLTYRLLENARHLPIVIHHGTNDELVPITGVQRMAARLAGLGYRYDMTTFDGYEHFTQAIVDEWADGAAYLRGFSRPENPRTVTYKVVPALVNAVNTVTAGGITYDFKPDGAYWVDALKVRSGDAASTATSGQIDVTSDALAGTTYLPLPRTGAYSPLDHSTPYVRHGLDWLETGDEARRNAFTATLRNLSTATLDGARMALDFASPVDGAVTSDGASTVTLTGVTSGVRVLVDGVEQAGAQVGDRVVLQLAGGEHAVRIVPAA